MRAPAGIAALLALSEGAIGRECELARRLSRACTPAADVAVEELGNDENEDWEISTEEDLAEEFEVLQSTTARKTVLCRDGKNAGVFVRLEMPTPQSCSAVLGV